MNGHSAGPTLGRETGLKSFDDYELTLGDLMRGERATLGKSLLDVQRDIKIKAEYLAGIEDADLSVFETPGFIAGYVKSYARYLGMSPDWVYQRFCSESGFSHVGGLEAQVYARKPKTRGGRTTPVRRNDPSAAMLARSPISAAPTPGLFQGVQAGAVGSVLVLAALAGALGYGGWSVLQEIQRVTVAPVDAPLAVAGPEAVARDMAGLGIDNSAPSVAAMERLYRPQALDTPVLVPRDGPIATLDPDAQGVFARAEPPRDMLSPPPAAIADADRDAEDTDDDTPEVQVVEAPPPAVVMFARRPAWVRVRAADGTVLLEKIMEEGERFVLPDSDVPPTLRAGNSGSVFFAVNGETYGPAGAGTSVAKNVVLSAEALTDSYAVADLSADPELARLAELVIAPAEPTPAAD
ncbi:helix-turn-helix domain-containing protein [Meridianimarinicoccus sp. RP-17]|uniref:helix-turn-helix domain-containing protein n=1 Tax=Meridianimarinicoccus zhengii TaxID=2056810 RepID=UPI000DAEADF3|nr:helix-turn-helix domain-containing protein [Phycocomes zhengii]